MGANNPSSNRLFVSCYASILNFLPGFFLCFNFCLGGGDFGLYSAFISLPENGGGG